MALVRFAPFDVASAGLDDLVRRTFSDTPLFNGNHVWRPALDAYIENDALHIRLEAPGMDPDNDLEIEVTGNALIIRGERKEHTTSEGANWFRREMQAGTFERRVALPQGVDAEAVRAGYDAGVISIIVPLPQKPNRKVKVEMGSPQQLTS